MNLLDTLLTFARTQEDPLTETLAWFLETNARLRSMVLKSLSDSASSRVRWPINGAPDISTQMVVQDPKGGTCRYDLVLDWHEPHRVRLIIEVKVWAGLTWKTESGTDEEASTMAHQLERYVRTASASPNIDTHIVLLAPTLMELDAKTLASKEFAGQCTWQSVRDAFARFVKDGAADSTFLQLSNDFIASLESRRMAAPKLTFDGLTSVRRYREFHAAVESLLGNVRTRLYDAGTLAAFYKGDRRAWQDDHDRIGWRLWCDATNPSCFAFLGVYVGDHTQHEAIPDLYFFLELNRGSPAQKLLDQHKEKIEAALLPMSTDRIRWAFAEGGYEAISARMSLVEVLRAQNQDDAAKSFFSDALQTVKTKGVMRIYFEAMGKPVPEGY